MTKTIALSLVLASSLALAACSGSEEATTNNVVNASDDAMNAAENTMNAAGNAMENAANAIANVGNTTNAH